MAAPAVTANIELASVPWLIRRLTITSGTTATALSHGGPAVVPDMIMMQNTSTNPTAGDCAAYSPSTTQITFDFEDDGNETWYAYVFWFAAAGGGITVS